MRIMISGSMAFAREMLETKEKLEKLGHTVFVPHDTDSHIKNLNLVDDLEANFKHAHEQEIMRKCFDLVAKADAILVLNHERRGVKGYMGVSTLMELALAYYLKKKLFVYNDIPKQNEHRWAHEVSLMNPIFIHQDLSKVK